MGEIRIKTVGCEGKRDLARAKGDHVSFLLEAATWSDKIGLSFTKGKVAIVSEGVVYPRRWYRGEALSNGILVTHVDSDIRVLIPLHHADRPAVRIRDMRGLVDFIPDFYQIARQRLLAATGRAALWTLLAVLLLLAGCAAEVKATCSETTPHNSKLLGAVYAPINERKRS